MNPVEWWHDLEGGSIASTRPPPPNADAPYGNLSTVPTRPQAIDAATRGRIASGLIADRANAEYEASVTPLAQMPPPAAAAPAPPPAASGSDNMSASLDAASRPPAPAAPAAAPAPVAAPALVPAPAPALGPAPGAAAGPAAPGLPELRPATAPAAEVAMPPIPDQPPPPPSISDSRVPAIIRPTPPRPTPPPAPLPAVPLAPGAPVAVGFAEGSAVLPASARAQLVTLAQRRGAAAIAVAGYGGAWDSDPAAQSAALPLARERAQAIVIALQAAGVPDSALLVTAEALGRGGVARIAN
jgi:outer membrane protein OmpA-like peptidoglycan-associated protein